VGDLVLLVGLGAVLLCGTAPSSERALQFMAAGLIVFVAADILYGWKTLNGSYVGGDPIDTVYVVAMALFTVAASAQLRPTDPVPQFARRAGHQRASWAPAIAVAGGFGLLLFSERNDPLLPNLTLVLTAVAIAALVSIRQFLAQRDLVRTQGKLAYQSLHDGLTGLPNRVLVIDRAERMLARARRNQTTGAVLFVDVDGFKHVNDSFGHAAGDELLCAVAARLRSVVRDADTVGRLGGDEFVLLLDNETVLPSPELVAERVCKVLAQPLELEHTKARTLTVTASIGIAVGQTCTADELLRDADLAMYEAKGTGKNRWVMFNSSIQTAAQDRLGLEMDLKAAIESDELFVLYQPTVDLETESITGVEALARWRHPTRGVISPTVFIPIAEETGLIVPIGRWVLRTACEQAMEWRDRSIQLGLSVNVSGQQLDQLDFVEDVSAIIAETGINPGTLTLEITETALMRDRDAASVRMHQLKGIGVRIAIDDFGTGYSSLAYLRQFPVDALKIDRSFIAGLATSSESKALVHTLVQLAKALGLETVGEGIEERAQLRQLQRENCDSGQGFLFARPLTPSDIQALCNPPIPPIA
jgi:diguanylate cyclase (GGDEF)-like protein